MRVSPSRRRGRRLSETPVFFFQAEDGIRDLTVTGVQTCALPISCNERRCRSRCSPPDGLRGGPIPRDTGTCRARTLSASRRASRRGRSGAHPSISADRKSTRLNSSHSQISYAVFCLKKKKKKNTKQSHKISIHYTPLITQYHHHIYRRLLHLFTLPCINYNYST